MHDFYKVENKVGVSCICICEKQNKVRGIRDRQPCLLDLSEGCWGGYIAWWPPLQRQLLDATGDGIYGAIYWRLCIVCWRYRMPLRREVKDLQARTWTRGDQERHGQVVGETAVGLISFHSLSSTSVSKAQQKPVCRHPFHSIHQASKRSEMHIIRISHIFFSDQRCSCGVSDDTTEGVWCDPCDKEMAVIEGV